MKKIPPLFFQDLHSTTLSPHSGHGIRGIPLGPSGYRETAPVGMNDELDEPSPIAWRDAGRRGGPGDARSGDGGLARTGGLAGAAFAWGRAPGRLGAAAADPATGRAGTCSRRRLRASLRLGQGASWGRMAAVRLGPGARRGGGGRRSAFHSSERTSRGGERRAQGIGQRPQEQNGH